MVSTLRYCEGKMPVGTFQSMRAGTGYPGGPNALWSDTMEHFYQEWASGRLRFESVFTFEADGAPLRRDWITELIKAHKETLAQRLLITEFRVAQENGQELLKMLHENWESSQRAAREMASELLSRCLSKEPDAT